MAKSVLPLESECLLSVNAHLGNSDLPVLERYRVSATLTAGELLRPAVEWRLEQDVAIRYRCHLWGVHRSH